VAKKRIIITIVSLKNNGASSHQAIRANVATDIPINVLMIPTMKGIFLVFIKVSVLDMMKVMNSDGAI